jgi:hypothetical protein
VMIDTTSVRRSKLDNDFTDPTPMETVNIASNKFYQFKIQISPSAPLLPFQGLRAHSVSYLDGSAKKSIALKKVLNSAE